MLSLGVTYGYLKIRCERASVFDKKNWQQKRKGDEDKYIELSYTNGRAIDTLQFSAIYDDLDVSHTLLWLMQTYL